MSQYLPKQYELFDGDINVKVALSNLCNKNRYKIYLAC